MLYFSIALVICFALYVKYKPEITINHTYTQKFPTDESGTILQTEKEIEEQGIGKDKKITNMDGVISALNSIMNGEEVSDNGTRS